MKLLYNNIMDLEKIPVDEIKRICSEYQISLMVLHGSKAKGIAHVESDTDIAILGKEEFDLSQLLAISAELESIFPNTDVCDLNSTSSLLKAAVATKGKLIFESSKSLFAEWRLRAFREYQDFLPVLEDFKKRNQQEIAKLGRA